MRVLFAPCDLGEACTQVRELRAEVTDLRRRWALVMMRSLEYGLPSCPRFIFGGTKDRPECPAGMDSKKCERLRRKCRDASDARTIRHIPDCWLRWIDGGMDVGDDCPSWLDTLLIEAGELDG